MAIFATFEASSWPVPKPLMRWDLLSQRLLRLHLLRRCTVLSRGSLRRLLRLPERRLVVWLIGPPSDNLNLLSVRVDRRPYGHPLPLSISLRLLLKTLHGNGGVHQCSKGLIVRRVQLLLKDGTARSSSNLLDKELSECGGELLPGC